MSEHQEEVRVNLAAFARGFLETFLDSDELRQILDRLVREAVDSVVPRKYQIVTMDEVVSVTGARDELPSLVQTLKARIGSGVMVVGPAGSGKTTLGRQCADVMDLSWIPVSCNPELTGSALLGRNQPNSNGGAHFARGPFLRMYEDGGIIQLEEFDTADPSILLLLNTALDSDVLPVPNRSDNPTAKRHKDFYCILTANTFGDGASREYVGRMQQDAAFLDRFVGSTFYIDYDDKLEESIAATYRRSGSDVLMFVRKLRNAVRETKTRRIVSTRMLKNGCMLAEAGFQPREVVDRLLINWNEAERTKLEVDTKANSIWPVA